MEIINGYSYSLGLTPSNILSSDIATDNITESVNTKLFFFTGTMDLTALYNITSESSLLSTYASSYLGTVTAPLTYKFNKNKKTITIESATPNALRFKDPRYVNNSYIMGTSFTKPTIGARYKFKMTNSTLNSGFLVNGSSVNVTAKKEYYNGTRYTYDIESDFFTTTGNITITNPTALTYSGFEVVPYDTDGNIITNDIKWVAMKTGSNGLGDKFIFTDEIGTSNSPAFVTMSNKTSKYGVENILSNLKLELHEKGV